MSVCSERSGGVIDESHLGDGASGVLEFTLPLSVLPDWSKRKGPACPFWACHIPVWQLQSPEKVVGLCCICAGYLQRRSERSFITVFYFHGEWSADSLSRVLMWWPQQQIRAKALQLGIKGLQSPLQNRCQAQLQGWVTLFRICLIDCVLTGIPLSGK